MIPYGVMTFPYVYGNLFGGFNTRCSTLVHGFCCFWLFLMGCKELTLYCSMTPYGVMTFVKSP